MNNTVPVAIGPYLVGGHDFAVVAGPCSIESRDQFLMTGQAVRDAGAIMLRGGMFKLRTDPKSFQGLGQDAYSVAKDVKSRLGMPFISEVTDIREIEPMLNVVDVFQVGSRNMHNYALLKELGQAGKPILLKRGFSALIKEWLLAAEYLEKHGNSQIVLCERGIRTFETATRNTFDLNAIAYIKQTTGLPVIADPSHATGARELVTPMALAAAAAGADGIIVEVHPKPAEALSDGFQALTFADFKDLMWQLERVLTALDRGVARPKVETKALNPDLTV